MPKRNREISWGFCFSLSNIYFTPSALICQHAFIYRCCHLSSCLIMPCLKLGRVPCSLYCVYYSVLTFTSVLENYSVQALRSRHSCIIAILWFNLFPVKLWVRKIPDWGILTSPTNWTAENKTWILNPAAMDASSASSLWYRTPKRAGKLRQRIQDLRIPSPSYNEFMASRPSLDLSHNESARLAADCLLNQGLEGYQEMLNIEGEVDFLSDAEKNYIKENVRDANTGTCWFLHFYNFLFFCPVISIIIKYFFNDCFTQLILVHLMMMMMRQSCKAHMLTPSRPHDAL